MNESKIIEVTKETAPQWEERRKMERRRNQNERIASDLALICQNLRLALKQIDELGELAEGEELLDDIGFASGLQANAIAELDKIRRRALGRDSADLQSSSSTETDRGPMLKSAEQF